MLARTIPTGLRMLATLLAAQLLTVSAKYVQCPTVNLDPVILKGKRFFHSVTGEYFPIKGIAYYPRPNNGTLSLSNSVDFFTDEYRDLWEADIANFQRLGVNTIRIYAVDPSQNHYNFMCALQEAGIYLMVGLLADCEDCGIGPNGAPSCYPNSLKLRGQFIINEFSKYSNLLVFSAGNEATMYATNGQLRLNAPCQKKFLRDMRAYVDKCGAIPASILPRKVPIGMVNWDSEREEQTLYFNCLTDPSDSFENSEWYGLNSYQHCNPNHTSVDQLTGWISLRENFRTYNLSVPVVISEYGCRERFPAIGEFEAQRTWLQVDALYSRLYAAQFAGGVVFEYSAEKLIADRAGQGKPWPYFEFMKLNYGVGYYSPVDCDHLTTPCEYNPYPEFDLLQAKLATVDTSYAPNIDAYTPTGQIPQCPTGFAPLSDFVWPVDDEPDLPCLLVPTSPPTLQPSTSLRPSSRPSQLPSWTPSTARPTPLLTGTPSALPSTSSPPGSPTLSPNTMTTQRESMMPTQRESMNPTERESMNSSQQENTRPSQGENTMPTQADVPSMAPTLKPTTILSTIDAPAAFNQSPRPEAVSVAMPSPSPAPESVPSQSSSASSEASASVQVHPTMESLSVVAALLPFILYYVA